MADYGNSGIFNLFKSVGGNLPQLPTPPLVKAIEKGNKGNSGGRTKGFADLRGSVTPGSMEPAASNVGEGIQMQIAERHRAGAGYPAGVKKPDYYPVESRTILPRQETVTNKGGVVQTGKNLGGGGTPIDMSRSFDSLLQGVGQQPFGGTQLPTAMGNPYTATYKQTAGFGEGTPDIGGMNGVTYDLEGGRNALNATNLQDMAPFTPGAPLIEGGSERIAQQSTGISSSRLSDALEGVKTQEANREMTPERRQQMARAAFLNGDDSMSGLKARDAVNDVVYAGGQHYGRGALTEDGKLGDKYKIDRADSRDIASGKQTAAGLLDVYKSRITESQKDTPAVAQAPLSVAGSAVKSGFAAGAQTDFALNNNQGTPQVGVGPVVPTDKIPKDLSGKTGQEYLRKLDAGLLF